MTRVEHLNLPTILPVCVCVCVRVCVRREGENRDMQLNLNDTCIVKKDSIILRYLNTLHMNILVTRTR